MQGGHPVAGEAFILRSERDRRGLAACDLDGEAGAGEHAAGRARAQLFGDDFVRQAAAARLQSLARPQQGGGGLHTVQLAYGVAQAAERGDDQVQVGGLRCAREVALHAQAFAQTDAGQVALVFARVCDRVQMRAVATPQADLVGGAEGLCQRRSPRARAEHRDTSRPGGVHHRPQTSLARM